MKKLFVKIADNPEKREKGLMFCKSMDHNTGMLFKFPYAHHLRFWMKNTYIPLDIAFLNDDGKILQIENMSPLSTRAVTSIYPCKYALEVNSGWFEKESVKKGDYVNSNIIKKQIKLISQVIKREDDKKTDPTKRTDESKKERKERDREHGNESEQGQNESEIPPEMDVEGAYPEQPESVQAIPYEGEEGVKPEITFVRDMRGKIGVAEEHHLEMEILYSTKRGFQLPPRRVRQIENEGYVLKNGPNGEFLVAFDTSPTIQGQGWSIKGLQPKSFLIDKIANIQLFDPNGNQLSDEQIARLKNGEMINQVMQSNQQKNKLKGN